MEFDAFKLKRQADGVVTLTLDRPERLNALTFATYRQLCDFFRTEQSRDETRAVMLTGSGRGFCAGGDVQEIIGSLQGAGMREVLEFAWMTGELVRNMREFDRPIVAAINGTCAGSGAVIALAADFRVLLEGGSLSFLFTKVGLSGSDMGAAWLLPRVVGTARATEILMLGEDVPAEDALRFGLVNRLAPDGEVLEEARKIVDKLLEGPPLALRVTKRMLSNEWSMDLASALEFEAQAQALMMLGVDHGEFHRAFTEKRKPEFTGE